MASYLMVGLKNLGKKERNSDIVFRDYSINRGGTTCLTRNLLQVLNQKLLKTIF